MPAAVAFHLGPMRTLSGADMPLQLHANWARPRPEAVRPMGRGPASLTGANRRGGFFTSAYDALIGSPVLAACRRNGEPLLAIEQVGTALWNGRARNLDGEYRCWLLTVAPEARVFPVCEVDDLAALKERYGAGASVLAACNYSAMTRDYDGIWFTPRLMRTAVRTIRAAVAVAPWLFGPAASTVRDGEQTWWLAWKFSSVEDLGWCRFGPNPSRRPADPEEDAEIERRLAEARAPKRPLFPPGYPRYFDSSGRELQLG
jgi:hypothetical protein